MRTCAPSWMRRGTAQCRWGRWGGGEGGGQGGQGPWTREGQGQEEYGRAGGQGSRGEQRRTGGQVPEGVCGASERCRAGRAMAETHGHALGSGLPGFNTARLNPIPSAAAAAAPPPLRCTGWLSRTLAARWPRRRRATPTAATCSRPHTHPTGGARGGGVRACACVCMEAVHSAPCQSPCHLAMPGTCAAPPPPPT